MTLRPIHLFLLIGWAACAYAALSLVNIPMDVGHALCGPWG